MNTTGADPQAYGYDALGNLTTLNGSTAYQYDAFNRMSAAGGMSYYVNPEGQRLRKSGSLGTTYFAPDQSGPLLAENDNGAWIDYLWLGGRLIGREVNGQLEAIGDDQVGRPQVVTNAAQAVVWSAQNWPFTRTITVSNSAPLNLGFPGQYYDAETGLWNNGFRDYDPALGRYVESDPLGLQGGVNTYAYVDGDPLNHADALGLFDPCAMDPSICGLKPQPGYFTSAGIALTVSTVNPFTSGGGGVYGVNLQFTNDAGWHLYKFYTPNNCPSNGFNPGVSLTANLAKGSGSWEGPFIQTDASAMALGLGYFNTPTPGYWGVQLGYSAGTPAGIGQSIANYRMIW